MTIDPFTIKSAIENDKCPMCHYFLRVSINPTAITFYCAAVDDCGWEWEYERLTDTVANQHFMAGQSNGLAAVMAITEVFYR